jgi:hypothetical protein
MFAEFSVFDRIYVIHLPHRTDRRQEVQAQLLSVGLDLDQAPVHLFAAIRPAAAGDFPSVGARGCFLSHLGVLRHALAHGAQRILVLEDDFNFAPDFAATGPVVLRGLAGHDWSMFYGGHVLAADVTPVPLCEGLAQVAPPVGVGTTHCVGFQGAVMAQLVPYLEAMAARPGGDPQGGPMHIDGAYSWFRRDHPELACLLACPQLGYQRSSRTDVHALRWFDRQPGVRALAAWARRLRNRLR